MGSLLRLVWFMWFWSRPKALRDDIDRMFDGLRRIGEELERHSQECARLARAMDNDQAFNDYLEVQRLIDEVDDK